MEIFWHLFHSSTSKVTIHKVSHFSFFSCLLFEIHSHLLVHYQQLVDTFCIVNKFKIYKGVSRKRFGLSHSKFPPLRCLLTAEFNIKHCAVSRQNLGHCASLHMAHLNCTIGSYGYSAGYSSQEKVSICLPKETTKGIHDQRRGCFCSTKH